MTSTPGGTANSKRAKIRVLIVDDSAAARAALTEVLCSDPAIEVMATAADPYIAANRIRDEVPDVITLDLQMPRMDGLTFLKTIRRQLLVPVVICSSFTEGGAGAALRALNHGAVEIIQKPRMGARQLVEESRVLICDAVKAAYMTAQRALPAAMTVAPKLTADVMLPFGLAKDVSLSTDRMVVAGASTGGTQAIQQVLETLPVDSPGWVIVQHMPQHFTAAFASRLDKLCRVRVKEAEQGDPVARGVVLIAPGDRHVLVKRVHHGFAVDVRDGPLVCRHRPSVDVLFRSAARHAGAQAVGVLLTGMGDDGARGMVELMQAGAATIAQDRVTSVVFGMPAEAIKRGAASSVLPLHAIAREVLRLASLPKGGA